MHYIDMWSNSETFDDWVAKTHQQLIAKEAADVPCEDCTACCRAGQFIHVHVDEPAFKVIPQDLLVPVPGNAQLYLMGHNQDGNCPMLVDDRCSIYALRPHTCRVYDCRIFSAAKIFPDATQPEIAARARDWVFANDPASDALAKAVKTAATFLQEHQQDLFGTQVNEIQLSLSALKVRDLFVQQDPAQAAPDLLTAVKAVLQP